tara:strand:- start:30 stop:230 length:201 start_codon:yes stop_codon:yes gene_type:complete
LYSQKIGSFNIKIYPTTKNTFSYDLGVAKIEFQEHGDEIKVTFSNRIHTTPGIKTDKPKIKTAYNK